MLKKEKSKDAELISSMFENLSETGRIMVITYTSALRDAQLADKRAHPAAEPPELMVK